MSGESNSGNAAGEPFGVMHIRPMPNGGGEKAFRGDRMEGYRATSLQHSSGEV